LGDGAWHLPTISELRTLVRGCPAIETGGACGLTDSCLSSSSYGEACNDCSEGGGPADGCYWPDEMQGTCSFYLSSSPVSGGGNIVWLVLFDYGYVSNDYVSAAWLVRCVR